MKISPDGKKYLSQVLEKSKVKTLRFYGIQGCCSINLGIVLEDAHPTDEVLTIDGIPLAIDPLVKNELEKVTIHAEEENGEIGLLLIGYVPHCC